VVAGLRKIEVATVRITDAGRKALAKGTDYANMERRYLAAKGRLAKTRQP
jgi:hypothetical protein